MHVPALAPMEPAAEGPSPYTYGYGFQSNVSTPFGSFGRNEGRLSEILERKDGGRRLPAPMTTPVGSQVQQQGQGKIGVEDLVMRDE